MKGGKLVLLVVLTLLLSMNLKGKGTENMLGVNFSTPTGLLGVDFFHTRENGFGFFGEFKGTAFAKYQGISAYGWRTYSDYKYTMLNTGATYKALPFLGFYVGAGITWMEPVTYSGWLVLYSTTHSEPHDPYVRSNVTGGVVIGKYDSTLPLFAVRIGFDTQPSQLTMGIGLILNHLLSGE